MSDEPEEQVLVGLECRVCRGRHWALREDGYPSPCPTCRPEELRADEAPMSKSEVAANIRMRATAALLGIDLVDECGKRR